MLRCSTRVRVSHIRRTSTQDPSHVQWPVDPWPGLFLVMRAIRASDTFIVPWCEGSCLFFRLLCLPCNTQKHGTFARIAHIYTNKSFKCLNIGRPCFLSGSWWQAHDSLEEKGTEFSISSGDAVQSGTQSGTPCLVLIKLLNL